MVDLMLNVFTHTLHTDDKGDGWKILEMMGVSAAWMGADSWIGDYLKLCTLDMYLLLQVRAV